MHNRHAKALLGSARAALIGLAMLAVAACTSVSPGTSVAPGSSVSPGSSASPGQATVIAKLGETVTVERTWQMTALNFRAFNPKNLTPTAGLTPSAVETQTAGNQYVAVQMLVKNISTQAQQLNKTGTFTLSDTEGHHYQEITINGLSISANESMPARAQQEGILVFQVPNMAAKHFVLSFASTAQPSYAYVQWSMSS